MSGLKLWKRHDAAKYLITRKLLNVSFTAVHCCLTLNTKDTPTQIVMAEELTALTKGAVDGTQYENLMAFSQYAIAVSTKVIAKG